MRFSGLLFCLATSLSSLALAGCGSNVSGGDGGGGSTSTSTTTTSGTTTTSTTTTTSGPPACATPPSPAAFEIGTGDHCFERLTDGQTVKVIQGPQGGFHLWLSFGCSDCNPAAAIEYGVIDPTTGTWFEGTFGNQATYPFDGGGWVQWAGLQNRLPGVPWDETTKLPEGTHVIVSGSVLDGTTVVHHAEFEVVLGPIEMWYPPCDDNPATCGAPGGLPCCSFNGGG